MLKESLTAKEQRAAILQTEVLCLLIIKCNRSIFLIASVKVMMCLLQVCVEGILLKKSEIIKKPLNASIFGMYFLVVH